MPGLTVRELRKALDVARMAGDDEDGGGHLSPAVLHELGRAVGCDIASATAVDHGGARLLGTVTDRPDQDLLRVEGFGAVAHEHPGFVAHREGRLRPGVAVALSDLASVRTLRRLPLYEDFYRPRGTLDQLLCVVELTGRRGTVLTFSRGRRGFRAGERALVELLSPHLSQSLARRRRLAALVDAERAATGRAARIGAELDRWHELTARERHVAGLAAGGVTDRGIARHLGISHRTVHKHLEATYRKLGIGSRTQLAALVGGLSD